MKKIYNIYQYLAFLIIFPFSTYIWYRELNDIKNTLLIISLPVVVAYVIPALGTNVTKLWSFNTKYKLGNFRIYHGFVLGASFNIFGFMLYKISPHYTNILETIFFSIISGCFIGFINWYYDIYAVKSGFIIVNNKLAYEKKSAHEIVTDYAPTYFFMFGVVYAIYIKVLEIHFVKPYDNFHWILVLMYMISLVIPTSVYSIISYIKYRNFGISQYKGLEL